jgi:hypothetical protein
VPAFGQLQGWGKKPGYIFDEVLVVITGGKTYPSRQRKLIRKTHPNVPSIFFLGKPEHISLM